MSIRRRLILKFAKAQSLLSATLGLRGKSWAIVPDRADIRTQFNEDGDVRSIEGENALVTVGEDSDHIVSDEEEDLTTMTEVETSVNSRVNQSSTSLEASDGRSLFQQTNYI